MALAFFFFCKDYLRLSTCITIMNMTFAPVTIAPMINVKRNPTLTLRLILILTVSQTKNPIITLTLCRWRYHRRSNCHRSMLDHHNYLKQFNTSWAAFRHGMCARRTLNDSKRWPCQPLSCMVYTCTPGAHSMSERCFSFIDLKNLHTLSVKRNITYSGRRSLKSTLSTLIIFGYK